MGRPLVRRALLLAPRRCRMWPSGVATRGVPRTCCGLWQVPCRQRCPCGQKKSNCPPPCARPSLPMRYAADTISPCELVSIPGACLTCHLLHLGSDHLARPAPCARVRERRHSSSTQGDRQPRASNGCMASFSTLHWCAQTGAKSSSCLPVCTLHMPRQCRAMPGSVVQHNVATMPGGPHIIVGIITDINMRRGSPARE